MGPQGAVAVGRGAPGPPLPRPVLPRERWHRQLHSYITAQCTVHSAQLHKLHNCARGYLDKFVEYLVGDGPTNRFS